MTDPFEHLIRSTLTDLAEEALGSRADPPASNRKALAEGGIEQNSLRPVRIHVGDVGVLVPGRGVADAAEPAVAGGDLDEHDRHEAPVQAEHDEHLRWRGGRDGRAAAAAQPSTTPTICPTLSTADSAMAAAVVVVGAGIGSAVDGGVCAKPVRPGSTTRRCQY